MGSGETKKKNMNIEAARICACFFVIAIHLWGAYRMWGGEPRWGIVFVNSMTRGAVAVFFMITGFLFESRKSLVHMYKRFFYRILLPFIIVVLVNAGIVPVLLGVVLPSAETETVSLGTILFKLLSGRVAELPYCFHLWYIVELIKCYLLFPVFKLLCRQGAFERRVRWLLIGLGILFLLVPDTLSMFGVTLNMGWDSPIGLYAWYIMVGYEIKVIHTETERKGRKGLLYFAGYLAATGIIYLLTIRFDYLKNGAFDKTFWSLSSLFCAVQTICLLCFFLVLRMPDKLEKWHGFWGDKIYGIYLIHVIVYSIVWHLHIEALIDHCGPFVFCILFSCITFFLSGFIVYMIQLVFGIIKSRIEKAADKFRMRGVSS